MYEPPPGYEIVFRTRQRDQCLESRLVLSAAGISAEASYRDGWWLLVVGSADLAISAAELDAYRLENPVPSVGRNSVAPVYSGAAAAVFVYATIIILIFILTAQSAFGLEWLPAGRMQAGRVMAGESWRTVTALTLHLDVGHILSNLVFGAVFGLLAGQCSRRRRGLADDRCRGCRGQLHECDGASADALIDWGIHGCFRRPRCDRLPRTSSSVVCARKTTPKMEPAYRWVPIACVYRCGRRTHGRRRAFDRLLGWPADWLGGMRIARTLAGQRCNSEMCGSRDRCHRCTCMDRRTRRCRLVFFLTTAACRRVSIEIWSASSKAESAGGVHDVMQRFYRNQRRSPTSGGDRRSDGPRSNRCVKLRSKRPSEPMKWRKPRLTRQVGIAGQESIENSMQAMGDVKDQVESLAASILTLSFRSSKKA